MLGPDLGGLVTIPDESAPVSSLFNPTRTVENTLRDQTPQRRGLKKSVVPAVGLLVGETNLFRESVIFLCVSSRLCLYFCCGIRLPCSRIAAEGSTSMLMRPLADGSGHLVGGV